MFNMLQVSLYWPGFYYTVQSLKYISVGTMWCVSYLPLSVITVETKNAKIIIPLGAAVWTAAHRSLKYKTFF